MIRRTDPIAVADPDFAAVMAALDSLKSCSLRQSPRAPPARVNLAARTCRQN
jgi:hypothetical protein